MTELSKAEKRSIDNRMRQIEYMITDLQSFIRSASLRLSAGRGSTHKPTATPRTSDRTLAALARRS